MRRRVGSLGRDVERLLRDGVDPPGGDARLLHRFLADRDPSAFEAIVDRHGPPVLAVCRRYLKEPADVEDAFQATFLVLVRKASDLRDRDALSSWLYGVAYRVAVRARSDALKRRAREGEREGLQDAPAEPSRPVDDALEVLDAELSRLPEKYRAPLALCYLEGRTHDQAAAELGWPVGTVRSRMARGRTLLRDRLSRRGIDAPSCLAALRAEVAAIPTVPSSLVAATAAGAVRFAGVPAGLAWLAASPSSSPWPAARLALGVISTMSTTPWKMIGLVFVCAGITAGAFAAGSRKAPDGPQEQPPVPPGPEKPLVKGTDERLADVERKLDFMVGLFESLTSLSDRSSQTEAAGLASVVTVIGETRTLREIEAQLINVERKYRIVERYTVDRGRVGIITPYLAESLREDAVAPARILVARLREMEDEARAVMARFERSFDASPGTLDDPRTAAAVIESHMHKVEDRLRNAQEALKARGMQPEYLRGSGNHDDDPTKTAVASEYRSATDAYEAAARLLHQRVGSEPPLQQAIARFQESLEPTRAKLAEIRRLIAWAKSHFPDVERTVDDATASGGDVAK